MMHTAVSLQTACVLGAVSVAIGCGLVEPEGSDGDGGVIVDARVVVDAGVIVDAGHPPMPTFDTGAELVCTYGGIRYVPRAQFPASDGCNTCQCVANEYDPHTQINCTDFECAGEAGSSTAPPDASVDAGADAGVECYYEGKTFAPGTTFIEAPGCGRCGCDLPCSCEMNGSITCALVQCGDASVP